MNTTISPATIYRLRNGARDHLEKLDKWKTIFDYLPMFDGLTGVILHEYNDVYYPHVIFRPFCSGAEVIIAISHSFIEQV